MLTNEASVDRVVRVVLGLGLIGLAVAGWFTPWGWIGVVLLATGVAGFCPLYRLVGINTCRRATVSPGAAAPAGGDSSR